MRVANPLPGNSHGVLALDEIGGSGPSALLVWVPACSGTMAAPPLVVRYGCPGAVSRFVVNIKHSRTG